MELMVPRFSIVITTRNRADLVVNSLQSVLEQDFTDFEVIVSDNSDEVPVGAARKALGAMLEDERVRYVRPETVLPMTAHWEWAVAHAQGEYVGILTDRMVIRLYTLSTVDSVLRGNDLDLICYERANIVEDDGGYIVPSTDTQINFKVRRTEEFIEAFSKSDYRRLDNPRFLNGFASAALLTSFRQKYGSIFTGIAPDYSFLMRVLDDRDEVYFVENTLLLKHSEDRSNGKSFTHMKMTRASQDFLERMRKEQSEFVRLAPLPDDVMMITNLMAREYEIGRGGQKSGKLKAINNQAFYDESVKHLRSLKEAGADVSVQLKRMENYRKSFGLAAYRPACRERRRSAKKWLKRILGMNVTSVKKRPKGERFSSIIEALRVDAADHATYKALHIYPNLPELPLSKA
jgi:glycosyltransferase involved in cell wall biosynthesis